MRYKPLIYALMLGFLSIGASGAQAGEAAAKKTMDYKGYAEKSVEIDTFRKERLLDIPAALNMAKDGKAILVDVRDPSLYKKRHIEGAVNLSVAEITEENLAALIPSKNTPVILYCDIGIYTQPTRLLAASNMAYPAFYVHGYRNIYELQPLWKAENAQEQYDMIPFVQEKH